MNEVPAPYPMSTNAGATTVVNDDPGPIRVSSRSPSVADAIPTTSTRLAPKRPTNRAVIPTDIRPMTKEMGRKPSPVRIGP